ncbi:MAG: DUF432 domain-containing protein [Candidatus Methanofastidiosia archaeon]|jgi:hypothetical protein
MFGSYPFGETITLDTVTIKTYKKSGLPYYSRTPDTQKALSSPSTILVHPVEPVTQPKEITHYYLVELDSPLHIASKDTITLFLTFPIEIGIYASSKPSIHPIDTFTLTNPKYTLYGPPEKGIVCKWWKSPLYSNKPSVNPAVEGIMKVIITSESDQWTTLTKIVFNAYHMKLYYSTFAFMNAAVKVDSYTVRTTILETPLDNTMERATELYRLRKIPVIEKKEFLMEWVP